MGPFLQTLGSLFLPQSPTYDVLFDSSSRLHLCIYSFPTLLATAISSPKPVHSLVFGILGKSNHQEGKREGEKRGKEGERGGKEGERGGKGGAFLQVGKRARDQNVRNERLQICKTNSCFCPFLLLLVLVQSWESLKK
jgi:hypothetical protein